MIYPTLAQLLEKVDSKYTLVTAVSKRAREIVDGSPKLVDIKSNKPVTIAVNEIAQSQITYERRPEEDEHSLIEIEAEDILKEVDSLED